MISLLDFNVRGISTLVKSGFWIWYIPCSGQISQVRFEGSLLLLSPCLPRSYVWYSKRSFSENRTWLGEPREKLSPSHTPSCRLIVGCHKEFRSDDIQGYWKEIFPIIYWAIVDRSDQLNSFTNEAVASRVLAVTLGVVRASLPSCKNYRSCLNIKKAPRSKWIFADTPKMANRE